MCVDKTFQFRDVFIHFQLHKSSLLFGDRTVKLECSYYAKVKQTGNDVRYLSRELFSKPRKDNALADESF